MSVSAMKRTFLVRVTNGQGDESEVRVSVNKRRTIAGFAILKAIRVIPPQRPYSTEILKEL